MIKGKYIGLLLVILHCGVWVMGQNCPHVLTGQVLDRDSKEPLEFANILHVSSGVGEVTGEDGSFKLKNLCDNTPIHLSVSHIGCEPMSVDLILTGDSSIVIYLVHAAYILNDVVVEGRGSDFSTELGSTVESTEISQSANENLSDLLSSIEGVSVLKTGSGISKPIVHGLYGNRIGVMNNGIPQAGQQWGNDHAPEIDVFAADELKVIKGSSALAYATSTLGSVVEVNMKRIPEKEGLHGKLNYIFQSNGRGHTGNVQVEKYHPVLSWRLKTTIKHIGDRHSPQYFMTNTGQREKNFSLQLEKTLFEQWQSTLYYSLFSTESGILRGSHIGNLTDLELAIGRSEPFFTSDSFSYTIQAPKQNVNHQLLKWQNKYFLPKDAWFEFNYGGQINAREEYDVRRGGRTDVPALSMKLWSHYLEELYHRPIWDNGMLKIGFQQNLVDNTNQPETGVLPLIPDYRSMSAAGFLLLEKKFNRLFLEMGSRVSFKNLDVQAISRSVPREIQYFNHTFLQGAYSIGGQYEWNDDIHSKLNIGYMSRSPEVNELYSFGLHQGVSGIEQGDPNLEMEKSMKITLSQEWTRDSKWRFNMAGYFQSIQHFIYLQPLNTYELTIRGAFPVFEYRQLPVIIYGMDFNADYSVHDRWRIGYNLALVRGQDTQNDLGLLYIPSDNMGLESKYQFSNFKQWKNPFFSVTGNYVFRQGRIQADQDFLKPPDGYFLLGLKIGSELMIGKQVFNLHVDIQNATNSSYRDYLNRQRYYADEVGFSANVAIQYCF